MGTKFIMDITKSCPSTPACASSHFYILWSISILSFHSCLTLFSW